MRRCGVRGDLLPIRRASRLTCPCESRAHSAHSCRLDGKDKVFTADPKNHTRNTEKLFECNKGCKPRNLRDLHPYRRRGRDSNPRKLALQRFSRPPQSTTLPPLQYVSLAPSSVAQRYEILSIRQEDLPAVSLSNS